MKDNCLIVFLDIQTDMPVLSFVSQAPDKYIRVSGDLYTRYPNDSNYLNGAYNWLWSHPDELAGVQYTPYGEQLQTTMFSELKMVRYIIIDPLCAPGVFSIMFDSNIDPGKCNNTEDQEIGENVVLRSRKGRWAITFDLSFMTESSKSRLRLGHAIVVCDSVL